MNDQVAVKGVSETKQFLAALKGQIPYATSLALNRTGKEVIAAQKDQMRRDFDEPTPYTLNSLFATKATKVKQETRTRIKSPTPTEQGQTDKHYVGVQIWGGVRRDKASEKSLRKHGLLPSGYQMVPGAGLKLNKYGNVSGGRVAAIVGALGANTSATTAAGTILVGEVGGTKGIWQVQARKWLPLFIFVKTPRYDPLLDYYGVSDSVFKKRWPAIFGDAIDQALRTAR